VVLEDVAGDRGSWVREVVHPEALGQAVTGLLGDRRKLAEMGENARAFARPDAARLLADLLFEAEGTR